MILHFREEKEKGILFSRDSRGEREIQNTKINQNLVQIALEGCKMASQASCNEKCMLSAFCKSCTCPIHRAAFQNIPKVSFCWTSLCQAFYTLKALLCKDFKHTSQSQYQISKAKMENVELLRCICRGGTGVLCRCQLRAGCSAGWVWNTRQAEYILG